MDLIDALHNGLDALKERMLADGHEVNVVTWNARQDRALDRLSSIGGGSEVIKGFRVTNTLDITLEATPTLSDVKQVQEIDSKVFLTESDVPVPVGDSGGLRAGIKALQLKQEKTLQGALDLLDSLSVSEALRTQIHANAGDNPNDLGAKLASVIVLTLGLKDTVTDKLYEAQNKASELQKKLAAHESPEEALRNRLKLKMRANYQSVEEILKEFQTFILGNYGTQFPEAYPNAVPSFLESREV